ncbi:hypothetical protein VTK56DRAFT_2019 [Thermocarpiscus australiensis]
MSVNYGNFTLVQYTPGGCSCMCHYIILANCIRAHLGFFTSGELLFSLFQVVVGLLTSGAVTVSEKARLYTVQRTAENNQVPCWTFVPANARSRSHIPQSCNINHGARHISARFPS